MLGKKIKHLKSYIHHTKSQWKSRTAGGKKNNEQNISGISNTNPIFYQQSINVITDLNTNFKAQM